MAVIICRKIATFDNAAVQNQNKNKSGKEKETCVFYDFIHFFVISNMDSTPSTSSSAEVRQLQIKLKTTQETYAVPDSTLSVPENVDPEKLNKLIKSLLNDVENIPEFDFFLSDDLLRTTLGEFIKGKSNLLKVIFSDGLIRVPEN